MTPPSTGFCPSFHIKLASWTLLFFTLFLVRAHAAQVTLSWTANSEIDLAGYKVYSGAKSHIYDRPVVLVSAGQTSISLPMPEDGRTYFFAVTAYDVVNQESTLSTEVSWTSPLANKPPVAYASSLLLTEDVTATGTLLASDPDGNSLTYKLLSKGGKGTATLTNAATGAFTYKPNANAIGFDSFTFKANDGKLDSNVGTVSILIARTTGLFAKIQEWLGAYRCGSAGDGFFCLTGLNDAFWKNYRLSVTVSSLDDDVVDILFRCQDSNNYYRFTWNTQLSQRQLLKCEDGEATVLAEDNETGVFGKAYQFEVVADESTIEIRVDDALIFAVTDTGFEEGGVALRSLNHVEKGFFEDIQVEDLATGCIFVLLLP